MATVFACNEPTIILVLLRVPTCAFVLFNSEKVEYLEPKYS